MYDSTSKTTQPLVCYGVVLAPKPLRCRTQSFQNGGSDCGVFAVTYAQILPLCNIISINWCINFLKFCWRCAHFYPGIFTIVNLIERVSMSTVPDGEEKMDGRNKCYVPRSILQLSSVLDIKQVYNIVLIISKWCVSDCCYPSDLLRQSDNVYQCTFLATKGQMASCFAKPL